VERAECDGRIASPVSSQTEEGEMQKHSFHAFVSHLVPLSQPEQNANGCAHALHQEEACPSPGVPLFNSSTTVRMSRAIEAKAASESFQALTGLFSRGSG
jgi:hypothetical protein